MAGLTSVSDFVTRARVLLQDTVEPYRYATDELVEALNLGVLEARRLRPDLFLADDYTLPSYSSNSLSTEVAIDDQYKVAFLYYVVGHAQLRDDEDTQDARAAVFLNKFVAQLTTMPA